MNKKIILAAVATIAAVTAQGVYADETNVQGTVTEGNRTDTVTTAGAGQAEKSQNETAQIDKQPATETAIAGTESTSDHSDQSGNATQFTKDGTNIQVTNPEVVIDQSNGNGK